MKYSFKHILLSVINKNNAEKTLETLKEYNRILENAKTETSIKLNRFKYLCLNCRYIHEILCNDLSYISLEDIVSKDILDSIHMANINYPTEDTIIEQLFISNKIIQNIENSCKNYNKYINVVKDLNKFLRDCKIDYSNIERPYFHFSKDKKGSPIVFFCHINSPDFSYSTNNFKIYGFYGEYRSLSQKENYLQMTLGYSNNFSSVLELKNLEVGKGKDSDRGGTALQYLIKTLIPELNNVLNKNLVNEDLPLSKEFKTQMLYCKNNSISENDINDDRINFYRKNGFTVKGNNFYLKLK
ncbi:MAG: hypothetical protein KID00_15585 [Clostridium argentinense]|nr:hypothetical protein [Clostridium argentinense]